MATYEIKNLGESVYYKYRHRSRDGQPCAQPEFDRLRAKGERPQMFRWENFIATLVQSVD